MLKRILPHVCIDVAVIFMVLWVIDRVNEAMHMLSRDIFKIPFFIFLILVVIQSVLLIACQRRELPDRDDDNQSGKHSAARSGEKN